MFNYDQNASLSHIQQQERIAEGERSRLAAEGKPHTHIYGAVFAYAMRKLTTLEQALKAQPVEQPRTSTQEMAVVR